MTKKLTAKQLLFATEYLKDHNGTQSAIRAGYSEKTAGAQASRLLTNVNILNYIIEQTDKVMEKAKIDAGYVLTQAVKVHERCMQEEPVMELNYETKEMEPTGEFKFEHTGANKALEIIGKHVDVQCFKDQIELTHRKKVIIKDMAGGKFAAND